MDLRRPRRRMNADADTLERVHEMERIAAALDAATQGSGRSVVIEGPPGIGKTRLVQDARTLAKLRGFERLQPLATSWRVQWRGQSYDNW